MERVDAHYAGSLLKDGQVWLIYPPHENNSIRTVGFCDVTDWAALYVKEQDGSSWRVCRDTDDAREILAARIAEWLDEAKGLSSQLYIYEAYDWN